MQASTFMDVDRRKSYLKSILLLPKLHSTMSGEDSSAVQCPMVIWLQSHCCAQVLPPLSRFVRPVSSAVGRAAAVVLPGPADSPHSTQCLQQQRPTINTASVTLYTYLYIHSEGAAYRWQLRVDLPKHVHQKVGVLGWGILLRWMILPCCM